jgi:glutamyl-tRNA reductase/protoheme ferro-lyase
MSTCVVQPLTQSASWPRGATPAAASRTALLVDVVAPSPSHAPDAHVSALADALPAGWRVLHAAWRGRPSMGDALEAAIASGTGELVVVPTSPHFGDETGGTALRELYRLLGRACLPLNVGIRARWHDDAGFVNAVAGLIAKHATALGMAPRQTQLLFWAQGNPASYECGDPDGRVERTVALVTERLGWPPGRTALVYGGHVVPGRLGPSAAAWLAQLRRDAVAGVLVCPITFPADDPTALERLIVSAAGGREALGGRCEICPALDAQDQFVSILKDLVLRGSRPVTHRATTAAPLLTPEPPAGEGAEDDRSLILIGASVANGIATAQGPRVHHSTAAALASVRKSRKALHALLQWARGQGLVTEALVWETCQRIEFYGWLADGGDVAARECVAARIRHQLYGCEPDGLVVNVLFADAARHHLMRTACGLNSGLPGDTDVVAQLQTALRIAQCSGAAGARATQLVTQAADLAEEVRAETAWGRFSTGYCRAALAHLSERGAAFAERCHVVIGGSTTSRSVLSGLTEQFAVPQQQLTLVYRDHHGQMKLLRSAIGHGRRLRVHDYAEQSVLEAIAGADVVFFGIDQNEPVLDPGALQGLRDFVARPLTIVDFNSFGSLGCTTPPAGVTVWTASDLEEGVAAHADALYAHGDFARAVADAEARIEQRLARATAVP